MKKILFLTILFLTITRVTFAANINRSNNIYGISLLQPHNEDLKKAAEMINSNSGDWGYVTLVIQENDRNLDKWQDIFNQLRQLHLIPIIRLATQPVGEVWRRPTKDDADSWVNFLDSLNWVVRTRYIILFNEPNHGAEWGSEVDSQSYAEVAFNFAKKLKEKNNDFFIMLAGFDASAPSSMPVMQDEEIFIKDLLTFPFDSAQGKQFTIFNYIDGWSSHSYPNPGFSGSPYDYGRKSIRGYEWELNLLKSLGVEKDLPIFITETGWERSNENITANNYEIAYKDVWSKNDRIQAVTPFVFNYQSNPFLGFSWKKFNSEDFYQQYYTVQAINKTKGDPEIVDIGHIDFKYPKELVAYSSFNLSVNIKNLGQAIWDKDQNYNLRLVNFPQDHYLFSDLKNVIPYEDASVNLFLKTNSQFLDGKIVKTKIVLYKGNTPVIQSKDWSFYVLPLPKIGLKVSLFPKFKTNDNNFELQIFDTRNELVFKKTNIKIINNQAIVPNIQNIILGDKYRIVLLKPYYLPRQVFTVLNQNNNQIKFKTMYPFDFNQDGKSDLNDLITLIKNPKLFLLFLP